MLGRVNVSEGFSLPVLGVDVTEGYRVDGIVSPEEQPAGREVINSVFSTFLYLCIIFSSD